MIIFRQYRGNLDIPMMHVLEKRTYLMWKTKDMIFTAKQFIKFTRIFRQEGGNLDILIEDMANLNRISIIMMSIISQPMKWI